MKLLERFEAVARQRGLADNTIDAYRGWIEQFPLNPLDPVVFRYARISDTTFPETSVSRKSRT